MRIILNRHNMQNEFYISMKVGKIIKICSSEM
jgi:hypothetical protein